MPATTSPIPTPMLGVFDSGVGGLTVLRALLDHLPTARFTYLGDTARLPYGSKSRETVVRYAVSSARFLVAQGADRLVIACNTASALALEEIRAAVDPIPVAGVIEPGAQSAVAALTLTPTPPGRVLVVATAATVHSGAYAHALTARGVASTEKSCPLLVPLVEEGWIDHSVTEQVVRIYLTEALASAPPFTALLLGCTHYPLLRGVFARVLASLAQPLAIVDSAEAVALEVCRSLAPSTPPPASAVPLAERCRFFATDSAVRFAHLGSRFLGESIPHVQHVDLGD